MRMNNISDTGNYCKAIAARCDLESGRSNPFHGATDCKITDPEMVPYH